MSLLVPAYPGSPEPLNGYVCVCFHIVIYELLILILICSMCIVCGHVVIMLE